MSIVEREPRTDLNIIEIEILRHRLEALTKETGRTIERTAISPVVVESGDYGTAILGATGDLIVGGGKISMQFHAATHAVRCVLDRHDDVGPGDVFMSNDPHNGGGLHPQDVFIIRPVHVDGELVAWIVNSAHMMDMGGMVPGSFSPNATDCYMESIRVPPVRLLRGGVEQSDVWGILLTNIRFAGLVEMDLRALVAGANVGHDRMAALVEETGVDHFRAIVAELDARTSAAVTDRIAELADGSYRSTSWAEWKGELFEIPCELRIEGATMTFDFTGAAPQCDRFLNSKEHVVKSMLSMYLANYLLGDVPMNQGYLDAFDVHCPEGSILNATPPAPVAAAHLLACMDAVEASLRCLVAAAATAPESYVSTYVGAVLPNSALSMVLWSGAGHDGQNDAWLMLDNVMMGAPAGAERDGTDFYYETVSRQNLFEANDVETTEAWYPLRFRYRRQGPDAAHGAQRGGRGVELAYETTTESPIIGTGIGGHGRMPSIGAAGGDAGAPTRIAIERSGGAIEPLSLVDQGFLLEPGDVFTCTAAGGAAWGDPLDRDPDAVQADLDAGTITAETARDVYGVVPDDPAATDRLRASIAAERLARALAAASPAGDVAPSAETTVLTLAPGVDQRGNLAVSARTGAVLATAPAPWQNGCPTLVEHLDNELERRAYLDPGSGHVLHVEVVPQGHPASFGSMPARWTTATA